MTTTPSPPDRIVLKAVPESLCIGDENVVLDISELQRTIYLGETLDTSVVKAYARSDGSLMNANVAGTADLFGNTDWNLSEGLHDILLRVNASQTYGIRLYIDQIIRDRPEGSVSLQAQMIWPDAPLIGPSGLEGTKVPIFGPSITGFEISPAYGPREINVIRSPKFGPSNLAETVKPAYGPNSLVRITIPEYGPSDISVEGVYEPFELRDWGDYGVQWEPLPGADSYQVVQYDVEYGTIQRDHNADQVIFNTTETTFKEGTHYSFIADGYNRYDPMAYWRVYPVTNGVRDDHTYRDFCLINSKFINTILGGSVGTRTVNGQLCFYAQPEYEARENGHASVGFGSLNMTNTKLDINIKQKVTHYSPGYPYPGYKVIQPCKDIVNGVYGARCFTDPNRTTQSGNNRYEYRTCGVSTVIDSVYWNFRTSYTFHYVKGIDVGVYGSKTRTPHTISDII